MTDLPLYPLLKEEFERSTSSTLTSDQLKAIYDLLDKNWKSPQIANVLNLGIEDVEKVRLSR